MSYIDRQLTPDEIILFRTQKHLIIFLPVLFWVAFTAFFLWSQNAWLVKFAILPGIMIVLSSAYEGLTYFTSDFAVTNKRIIMKEGFFFRHSNETRIGAIANVTVNQSLLAQALNYGTLIINTFGGDNDPFIYISRPLAFQNAVLSQLDTLSKVK